MHLFLCLFGLYAALAVGDVGSEGRQSAEQCLAVTLNLGPVLERCSVSVVQCLTANVMGFGEIESIQELICPPTEARRNNIYDVLVGCTSQENADLVYSGICGSTELADGEVVLCTDAALQVNNGSAAKADCCSEPEASGTQCADELSKLVKDIGCCTGTVIFDAFFEECEEGAGIEALFQANNVTLPQLCDYPLYSPDSSPANSSSFMIIALSISFIIIDIAGF